LSRIPVSIFDLEVAAYPERPPFDPPEVYPEAPYRPGRLDPTNRIYPAVRESFRLLGLDAARSGTPGWNPLGEIVRPGDRVVVKPNLVRHFHGDGLTTESLITHGSVVRAVLDYVLIALRGEGKLTVGDSPLQYAEFSTCLRLAGLDAVLEEVRRASSFPVQAVDFRKERSEKRREVIVHRIPNNGDPLGYREVVLDGLSRFRGLDERCPRFRVTQYDPATMTRSHNPSRHAYLFPGTVLDADVLVNLPKLKTHRKAAITAAMKNLVGINGSKDWLPHHSSGSVAEGGDEYLMPSARKRLASRLRDRIESTGGRAAKRLLWAVERALRRTSAVVPFPDPYFEGSWYGNDTIWRTVHDLHRVLFFADREGVLRDRPQRRYLALIDGVVAGEGEGPMHPSPKRAGVLVGSTSPLAADLACCRLMGFDERKVPLLNYAVGNGFHPELAAAGEVDVRSNVEKWTRLLALPRSETFAFTPPAGWRGHVELEG
jgi:uncharacterized protein (DUF362 family)